MELNVPSKKYIMKKFLLFFLTLPLILFLNSCEDVVDLDLKEDGAQLVVDAWINNKAEPQVIKLRRTIPYFDNSFAPEVTGATVIVADSDSTLFVFEDSDEDGDYVWTPQPGQQLGVEGKEYALYIELDGDEYISLSEAKREPLVDSIGYEFRDDLIGVADGIIAQIYARDQVGTGDAYWIKTYKNGAFLNKAQEMNLTYDAAFGPGGNSDGILFIPPIRTGINRLPDTGDDAIDTDSFPPYEIGDNIRVEIHSLTQEAFFYLFQIREQMTQADNGLFATPITNVPSNIIPQTADAKEDPVGFFCVSLVSEIERDVE